MTNQLIFLPNISFLLSIAFDLNPTIAVDIIILACCPGGPTSNINYLEMGIPTVAYAIWMFLTEGILMWELAKRRDIQFTE